MITTEKGIREILSPTGALLGYRVYVTVHRLFRERSFPPKTPLADMKTWREATRAELRHARPVPARLIEKPLQMLYALLDPGMTKHEQAAIWTLIRYLKRKA